MRTPYRKKRLSILDFAYYVFMASVPIEMLGTTYFELPISLSLLAGVLFVIFYFISKKNEAFIFKSPPLIMLPIIWLTVAFLHSLLSYESLYITVLTGIMNNIFFSVILYNYLLEKPAGIRNGLLIMGLSTGLASIVLLSVFGLDMLRGDRFSVLEFDENNIASIFGLGALILFLFYQSGKYSFKILFLLLPLTLTPILIVVATGSRGIMAALVVALLFYILFVSKDKLLRLKNITVLIALIAVAIFSFLESPTTQQRWQFTIDNKEGAAFADRDKITQVVLAMIAEKPIFGWGLADGIKGTGGVLDKDAAGSHNTYLMIILTSGLIGGIPLFYYISYPLLKWKKNANSDQFRNLCVLLFFTMIIFLSLDMLNRKQYWIISTMLLATMARPTNLTLIKFDWRDAKG